MAFCITTMIDLNQSPIINDNSTFDELIPVLLTRLNQCVLQIYLFEKKNISGDVIWFSGWKIWQWQQYNVTLRHMGEQGEVLGQQNKIVTDGWRDLDSLILCFLCFDWLV